MKPAIKFPYITYQDVIYWYEHRLAKDGEICLATIDPKGYCNGLYTFSIKDPGDGMAFVVVKDTRPTMTEEELMKGI